MSRVSALQTLIGQTGAPAPAPAPAAAAPTQTAAPTTFGDALAASTSGSAASPSTSSTQSALLSLLEQSTAGQSVTSSLGGSSDSSGFSLPALPSLTNTLATALAPASSAATTPPTTGTGAQGILSAAETQIGVTEQPPGSNDGPQIAVYRDAVAGASPAQPWCASFVSWAAAQAGEPIGSNGQGLDSVKQITDWASSTGR